jgi:nucleoside-diphosphate-sugar epimerase
MRVVVVGATGNVGTSLLSALAEDAAVDSILGLARRLPQVAYPKTAWVSADVTRDDLRRHFRGADAVVHLAWAIQPSRDRTALWRTNVEGSTRVFRAVAAEGVPALVYASSVGTYSAGPKDREVDESWPTNGMPTSFYARHKAEVERRLDRFETEHSSVRVVRLRPALIFKREAATGIRRLFAGPFLPTPLLRRGWIPFVPDVAGLRFQAVHSYDVGEAYRLALVRDVGGAFNLAAGPVLDPPKLAELLETRLLPMPVAVFRTLADLTWRLRLQPSPVGWADMGLGVPIMSTKRARTELGWSPRWTAEEALLELLAGLREGADAATPPLDAATSGPLRSKEIVTGLGARE